ncbi:DUF4832 domain-containing protein [Alienimonas californiensis]|uniref:DUF4832 domain-containing protein n=1 Tax=Alienimonas californiensis TaxID=2527989 RepID=A0A517P563_9PLAN|nr:DUF4832 domain-containing protein [Alienimonas californiensis]QDT14520.1 hypothetical protein CA12_05950 [Alienimonas californiensis]
MSFALLVALAFAPEAPATRTMTLTPHAGFAENPLKGLMPYRGDRGPDAVPHSLEFQYVGLAELTTGPGAFTFDAGLEPILQDVASRGRRLVLRVYLDYPNESKSGVSQYLRDAGLKMRRYSEHGGGRSPDYEDERLIAAMETTVAALGERYDGDPRLGFLQVGLLGYWGEWHTYPNGEQFASEDVQRRVLASYEKAFKTTPVVARYPEELTRRYPVGFHDDSFAYSTLRTGGNGDAWAFLTKLEQAGAKDVWKTRSIGGEVRPEVQRALFDPDKTAKGAQDFAECVRQTHASWLLCSAIFKKDVPPDVRAAAEAGAKSLGYRFAATEAEIERTGRDVTVRLTFANRGVAPFLHNWPVRVGLYEPDGTEVAASEADWHINTLLPDQTVVRSATFPVPVGGPAATIGVTIPDPLPTAPPLRFANEQTDAHGILRLGPLP